jgi:hypothetical protein
VFFCISSYIQITSWCLLIFLSNAMSES